MKLSLKELNKLTILLWLHNMLIIDTTRNKHFIRLTTRQGTRIIVTRRKGQLLVRECLVKGLFTQTAKKAITL